MIEKVLLDGVKPEMIDLIHSLCQRQISKIQELQSYFKSTPADLSPSICGFLDVSYQYYRLIMLYLIFLKNGYMIDRTVEKTKPVEQIYYENNMLANSILDSKDFFVSCAEKFKGDPYLVEFPRFALAFFNEKLERDLKKAITTFESIKTSLDVKKMAGITVDSLISTGFVDDGEDQIERKLLEESGIKGTN